MNGSRHPRSLENKFGFTSLVMCGRILQDCSCGEVVQLKATFLCHPKKRDETPVSCPLVVMQFYRFAVFDSSSRK